MISISTSTIAILVMMVFGFLTLVVHLHWQRKALRREMIVLHRRELIPIKMTGICGRTLSRSISKLKGRGD